LGGPGVQYTNWALKFLQQVELLIGYKPAIYMSEYVENSYGWANVVAGNYGLWLAKYSDYEYDNNYDMSGAGRAPVSKHWPFYFMWQWTSKGHLNGYVGDLDCDIFYGDDQTWDAYAGVQLPSTTTTTTQEPSEPETTTTTTETPEPTTTTTTEAPVPPEKPVDGIYTTTTTTRSPEPTLWAAILAVLLAVWERLRGVSE
jgi:hypothetical protein